MKRDRLFVNGLMRLAACALAVLFGVGAGDAWGDGVAPINPKHIQWQREQKLKANRSPSSNIKRQKKLSASDDGVAQYTFGYVPGLIDKSYLQTLNITAPFGMAASSLPTKYDQRTLGNVTAVRNQGSYGTCWAHSTMGVLETLQKVKGRGTFDFSEKHLANTHGWSGYVKFDSGVWTGVFGDGAWAETAMAYLMRWSGPIAEKDDPYPLDSKVSESPSNPVVLGHVQSVIGISPMPTPASMKISDTEDIKKAVMQYGSVRASYTHIWGAMTSDRKNHYWDGRTDSIDENGAGGHSVLIIGWDDNYSKSKFKKTPPGDGAFIAKNSWGTTFGESGYFYISYYDSTFGRDELHAIPDLESIDNYGEIYEYDPLGWVNNFGSGNNMTKWGANIFTARKDDILGAIGFYATSPNTNYKLYIYTGCASSNPSSGECAYSASGTVPFFGYVTIPLSADVNIRRGQRFSVVLSLTTPGNKYPLPIEYATSLTMEATSLGGQSFYGDDGSNWKDFIDSSAVSLCNFCCKAYTKSATPPTPVLESIAITGISSIKSGESAQFTCEAIHSNGSKKNVSPKWSIAEGRNYATISTTGLVTTKVVTEQQTVTVKASYKEGNVTKEATYRFYVTVAAPLPPTSVTATQGEDVTCVRITWAASSGATEYAVYRASVNNSANVQYLGNVTVARYNDTDATPGVDYWYFVKAKNASDTSKDFSAGAKGWRKLSPPDDVTATDNLTDKVTVTWGATKGAKYYRVCRTDDIDAATYPPISGWINAKSFDDTTAAVGKTYFYYVQAAVDANGTRPSDYSIVEDGKRAAPVSLDSLSISGAASIPSGSNETYTATAKYTDGNTKAVTPSSWSLDSTTWASVSGGKVTARTVAANQTVKLTAEYTENGKTITGTKSIVITATQLSAPTGLKVTSQTTEGIVLTWNAMMGAASYNVYRGVGGSAAALIGSVPSATFTDKEATPGVTYAYSVSAVNGAGESAMSGTAIGTVPLSVPTGVTATDNMMGEVMVSWLPVVGATHYRVARASSASGTKTELGGWITEVSFKDDTPSEEMTYYYFVRAATSSTGVNASDWSEYALGSCKKVKAPNELYIEGGADTGRSLGALGWTQYYCRTSGYLYGRDGYGQVIWSVTPAEAATIDKNGLLRANAVAADTTATITATWTSGSVTLTATRDIFISGVGTNTASVKDVRATSRWPFSNLVDVDYVLETYPPGTKASVTIYGIDTARDTMREACIVAGDGQHDSSGWWVISEMLSAGRHRTTCRLDWRGEFDIHVAAAPEEAVQSGVTVAFDANGGASEFLSRNYQPGEPYRTLPRATRSEHSFVGWFTKNEGGERIAPTSIVPNTTSTLYARWADKMWKIDDYGELYGADFGDEKEVVFPEVSVISYVGGYCPAERMVIPESVTLIYRFGTSFPNLREVVILGAVGLPSGDDVLDYVDEGVLISWFPYGGADTGITIYVTEKWKGIMGDFLYGTVRPLADLSGKE